MTIQIDHIDPKAIRAQVVGGGGFKKSTVGFGTSMLDAANAMATPAATAGGMYGGNTALAAINAAFSGFGTLGATMASGGGGMGASVSGGMYGGAPGFAAQSIGAVGLSGANSAVYGSDGMTQMDMLNTMNQNNLQLLELQAVMQSNMQGWNTKSNILSADHRARMAIVEKFTTR